MTEVQYFIPLHVGLLFSLAYFVCGVIGAGLFSHALAERHVIQPAYGYALTFFGWILTVFLYLTRVGISYLLFLQVWPQGYWTLTWYTLFYAGMAFYFARAKPKNTSARNLLEPFDED